MKVAIVHDYLNQYGGAERVLDEMKFLYPEASVYTSIYDASRMPKRYQGWDIHVTWLDRLPFAYRKHQALLPFLPQAFEGIDLTGYDLVLSSSSGFAHGVLTGPDTVHICYCHSPPRFLWDYHNYAARERLSPVVRLALSRSLPYLRLWDRTAADRPDERISTSRVVQRRVHKWYGQDSDIIPPPIDVGRFDVGRGCGGYFLMLMRLVGWKRPEIAVEACNALKLPLVVAGGGRDLDALRRLAGPTIRFVGSVNDEQMRELYRDCRALLLPSEEDFGITPLEAMASGRPVIAFGRGGVLDTVVPGETGLFFEAQTVESLVSTLVGFDGSAFDPGRIRRHAEQFDREVFHRRLRNVVTRALHRHAEWGFQAPPELSHVGESAWRVTAAKAGASA